MSFGFFRSLVVAVLSWSVSAAAVVPVTRANFARAESDLFFSRIVGLVGIGNFAHARVLTPVDRQFVVRMNRDTLYSAAVFDLDAGPVTIEMPPAGGLQSMQVVNQDHFSPAVVYAPGTYVVNKQTVGTRYAFVILRALVNPMDANDMARVHAFQNAVRWRQADRGRFEIPAWDPVTQGQVRAELIALGATIPDSRGMFGLPNQVDPIRHLIGTAAGWGGSFEKDVLYLMKTPARNDGQTIHRMRVKDVPVDGFWSVSVYNAQGYFEKNPFDAYSLNNLTASKNPDGSVDIQFGGCDGVVPNCLPTPKGWNYWVRLYLPRPDVLSGRWLFPEAREAGF